MLVGRHASNDICLRDGSVSRHHAAIVPEKNGWLVIDLNSTNGTRLNGEVVRQAYLSDSDEVTVGRFRMIYHGRGIDVGRANSTDLRKTVVLDSDRKVG